MSFNLNFFFLIGSIWLQVTVLKINVEKRLLWTLSNKFQKTESVGYLQ